MKPCSHGFIANCPVHSYNLPESAMVSREIFVRVRCECSHYCANWPNCTGGKFRAPSAPCDEAGIDFGSILWPYD